MESVAAIEPAANVIGAPADRMPAARPSSSEVRFNALNVDLDVFQGPFDLLLELVMREEVDLLEVDLAQVVLAYVDLLERRGEIELEPVTEFVVLVAALLELKSRLMLPGEEQEGDEFDLGATEAADELLARMLAYRRYANLARWFAGRLADQGRYAYRSAPPPPELRRLSLTHAGQVYRADQLALRLGELLTPPPRVETPHMLPPRVTLADRLAHVRKLLRQASGEIDFDEILAGADRATECMTLWAILELYKVGEATWRQDASFGPISVGSTIRGATAPPLAASDSSVRAAAV